MPLQAKPVRRQNFVVREMNGLRGRVIDKRRGLVGVLKRLIVGIGRAARYRRRLWASC
jgi:hypothetical protein